MTDRQKHYEEMAAIARRQAETFRSYLAWSEDEAERAWATQMTRAAELEAEAHAAFAKALGRVPA